MDSTDVIIIGGGLAGLVCGIHLAKAGIPVTLFEKAPYPRHKVCGEYISNEVLPYLEWLGIDLCKLNPVSINRFEFSSVSGKMVKAVLPLGGVGISRYALDYYLYQKAVEAGCSVSGTNITGIIHKNSLFDVVASEKTYPAKIVIGAYGKRSVLDKGRDFFHKKSPWLAVKAHYKGVFPDDTVALHNFEGGYCGVSKVEGDVINICYLADYRTFKKYRNTIQYQEEVLWRNRHLKKIFENSTMLFEKPLVISQISFEKKEPVENHILMAGDTAGLIHPLCGNGMAMAISSAKIAAEAVLAYLSQGITREEMEQRYRREWNYNFASRLRAGRLLVKVLQNKPLTEYASGLIASFPSVLPAIIKQTHGKTITITP
ncbi:FAD-dependent oxidoreductase [Flavobacterium cyanobacteriorum]|uniref:FAD-dependent oxidoreductase n=1 Tax=Flavobacterium cyanobacteriorum TaxID=2022802 RepID=A0A255Z9Z8_9FLAO|nr:NAD(P)/FAD-dependent oxidoreductase [Flavobacterium cyanobacteriorum]OYQ38298.1 FAD-dependent oxidoreductase [Flavobacterium cyanobacteriorum]